MKKILLTLLLAILSLTASSLDNSFHYKYLHAADADNADMFFNAKTVWKYGKMDGAAAKETDDIDLNYFEVAPDGKSIRFQLMGRYNLLPWMHNKYRDEYQETYVNVCLFYWNPKTKEWIGGQFDSVLLGQTNTASLENIYNKKFEWPKFNKEFNNKMRLKMCLYNVDKKQRSIWAYNFIIKDTQKEVDKNQDFNEGV